MILHSQGIEAISKPQREIGDKLPRIITEYIFATIINASLLLPTKVSLLFKA